MPSTGIEKTLLISELLRDLVGERLRHLFSIAPVSEAKSHGIVRLALLRVR